MEASCCYVEVEFSDGDAEAADAEVTQAQHSSWNSKYHIYSYVDSYSKWKHTVFQVYISQNLLY